MFRIYLIVLWVSHEYFQGWYGMDRVGVVWDGVLNGVLVHSILDF
jgi:hypothetical protein